MSLFGWSLPAGCGTLPGEEDAGACDVCGNSVDNEECICPECPTCGSTGDPKCYHEHGLVWSETQQESWDRNNKRWEEEARAEAEYYANLKEED